MCFVTKKKFDAVVADLQRQINALMPETPQPEPEENLAWLEKYPWPIFPMPFDRLKAEIGAENRHTKYEICISHRDIDDYILRIPDYRDNLGFIFTNGDDPPHSGGIIGTLPKEVSERIIVYEGHTYWGWTDALPGGWGCDGGAHVMLIGDPKHPVYLIGREFVKPVADVVDGKQVAVDTYYDTVKKFWRRTN